MEGGDINSPLLSLVPLLPLVGSIVVFFLTNRAESIHKLSGWVATAFSAASFVVVCQLAQQLPTGNENAIVHTLMPWFSVGALNAEFSFRFDNLTRVMTLVVTGVGSLIHLYAIGYMSDDKHRPRFFCYLNLFLFAMLLLVLGDNLLVMFVGWEGVGLCSYLLIGFWFKEMPNAEAGQKAFVVNRIGDAGFILGMFLLVINTGSLNILEIQGSISGITPFTLELAAILLFVGAVGKSAQLPLFVWLPDAMAGPTPVSALIHAATMVTAGVYMITRLSFVYALTPTALTIILVVGTLTAFLAATIALVQNDIKKVLAYSTVSQLGYMFMALGSGAFSNGIYHVVTHAFFKACLFMAAGSVIIGCHHEQDMRHFGGLRKKMPFTFIAYLVATFAIAGFPFLSGFFSKDAILWSVFSNNALPSQLTIFGTVTLNQLCWGIGLFTAFLTAFYMTRSLVLTFFGEYRGHHEAHESPWVVTVPLIILAALSALFGWVYGETMMGTLVSWTRSDLAVGHVVLAENHTYHLLEMVSIVVAVSGMALAALLYMKLPNVISGFASAMSNVHKFLLNKWLVDELYGAIVISPLTKFSKLMFSLVDRILIDGSVNGVAMLIDTNGEIARRLHTGRISLYALLMLFSVLCLLLFWIIL